MRTINELSSLSGRVALVTGAAGTIGPVICETLAELGATVAVCDVNEKKCNALALLLSKKYGLPVLSIPGDLEDTGFASELPGKVADRFGSLSMIIYAAAYTGISDIRGWVEPLQEQTTEAFEKSLRVNLTSVFTVLKNAFPHLKSSPSASVILISSIYGIVGPDMGLYKDTQMGNPAGYGAAKGGILQLTRYFATTMSPRVRVNALSPGGIRSEQPDNFQKRYKDRTPLGRMAVEEDIKGAIAYLASDLSCYVTGHNLVVDGGWTAW